MLPICFMYSIPFQFQFRKTLFFLFTAPSDKTDIPALSLHVCQKLIRRLALLHKHEWMLTDWADWRTDRPTKTTTNWLTSDQLTHSLTHWTRPGPETPFFLFRLLLSSCNENVKQIINKISCKTLTQHSPTRQLMSQTSRCCYQHKKKTSDSADVSATQLLWLAWSDLVWLLFPRPPLGIAIAIAIDVVDRETCGVSYRSLSQLASHPSIQRRICPSHFQSKENSSSCHSRAS